MAVSALEVASLLTLTPGPGSGNLALQAGVDRLLPLAPGLFGITAETAVLYVDPTGVSSGDATAVIGYDGATGMVFLETATDPIVRGMMASFERAAARRRISVCIPWMPQRHPTAVAVASPPPLAEVIAAASERQRHRREVPTHQTDGGAATQREQARRNIPSNPGSVGSSAQRQEMRRNVFSDHTQSQAALVQRAQTRRSVISADQSPFVIAQNARAAQRGGNPQNVWTPVWGRG